MEIYEGDIVILSEVDECGATFTLGPASIIYKEDRWMFTNNKYKALGEKDWTDYISLFSISKRADVRGNRKHP